MDDELKSKIITSLKDSSIKGLRFEQAKERLLSEGYSLEQINIATDNYQYGNNPKSDIPVQVEKYFESHPEQALADGENLAKAVKDEVISDERTQAELDIMAAETAPAVDKYDIQARVSYESKFASDVGIPVWLLFVLILLVNGLAYLIVTYLKIDSWFYLVNGALTFGLIVLLIKSIR